MHEILAHPLKALMVVVGISMVVLSAVFFDTPVLMLTVIFPALHFLCSGKPLGMFSGGVVLVFFPVIHFCDLSRIQMERSGFLGGVTTYGGLVLMMLAVLHWCFRKSPPREEIS